MRPTKRTQPYRKNRARKPGGALSAMLKGRTLTGTNPMDAQRKAMKKKKY